MSVCGYRDFGNSKKLICLDSSGVERFLYTEDVRGSKPCPGTNMQRWQSGPMQRIANPSNRGFKSLPLLQLILGIVKWYHPCFGSMKRKFDSSYRDQTMREWWNGIHSRLKICRRRAYGFESRLSHQYQSKFIMNIKVNLSGYSIMDNTIGFYPMNVGSIPASRTRQCLYSLTVKRRIYIP